MTKTNVMRLLDAAGIAYILREYSVDEGDLSAVHAAEQLGLPPEQIFKTLVLRGAKGAYFVCCIPASSEMDLKKAAALYNEKSVEMLPVKDLLATTGYMRGTCSPVGMKKKFPTFMDETALLFDRISISAGKRGAIVFVRPGDIISFIHATATDLIKVTERSVT
jgi:Cys-tRNA(Pro)/Cys-tRNA(Cys) deacylase